jgi:hypothetical protein
MKTIASLSLLLLTASLFAAATTTTTTTVVTPPTKPVVVKPKVVTPQVNKKPEVERKCDDKNKSVVKVTPVTKSTSGTCNKK